jgi:hypothetical protein
MKTYQFEVQCASGAVLPFTCQANDEKTAIRLMREFALAN